MNMERAKEILDAYDRIECEDPDISTEMLLERTSWECDCGPDDVTEALYLRSQNKIP